MCLRTQLILAVCAVALSACGSGGSPAAPAAPPRPGLVAAGGTGRDGAGGCGGALGILSEGNTRVMRSGTAAATFSSPSPSSYAFGVTPCTITRDQTVQLDRDAVAAGLYTRLQDAHLYLGNGDGDTTNDPPVTGLHIAEGATLFVPKNTFYDWLPTYDFGISLENDLVIDGTLATAPGVASINVTSTAGSVIVGPTGSVTTNGADGGWIAFYPQRDFFNAGRLDASGADRPAGRGCSSGGIYVTAYGGGVFSSGMLLASGGSGMSGGNANGVVLYGGAAADPHNWPAHSVDELDPATGGTVVLSGTVRCRGGSGSAGTGGGYGILDIYGFGGSVLLDGEIDLDGGDGTGATGGSPTGVAIYAYGPPGQAAPPGSAPNVVRISGHINLSGGDGATGGNAGYFWVETHANDNGAAPDIELLGFSSLVLDGGEGTVAGGNGGYPNIGASVILTTIAPLDVAGNRYLPAGAVTNEADIRARGGNATASGGTGGAGGRVQMDCAGLGSQELDAGSLVTNTGAIDISGGGGTHGGSARSRGTASVYPPAVLMSGWLVTNSGTITARGGDGVTSGGNGGDITLLSLSGTGSPTANTGQLAVDGGKGATAGVSGSISIAP